MRATIRRKLVLLSLLILVVVSFAFTLLHHAVSRAWTALGSWSPKGCPWRA
jgi:hypothetical protein